MHWMQSATIYHVVLDFSLSVFVGCVCVWVEPIAKHSNNNRRAPFQVPDKSNNKVAPIVTAYPQSCPVKASCCFPPVRRSQGNHRCCHCCHCSCSAALMAVMIPRQRLALQDSPVCCLRCSASYRWEIPPTAGEYLYGLHMKANAIN